VIVPRPADSTSLLRSINSSLVLNTIRTQGPLSRAELSRATGLSKPTITLVAERLLAAAWVEEIVDSGAPLRPGRKAPVLRFRADLGYVLGVDVGASTVLALVSDLSGTIVGRGRQALGKAPRRKGVLAAVRRTATTAISDAGIDVSRICAAGVGTPGVIDPKTGKVSLAPQIEGWDGTDLAGELGAALPCPILVDNESSLSLLAESWRGSARGYNHVAFVQMGIGIGGAILIDGRIYGGRGGAAGEFGYLVDDGEPDDVPPHVGLFEWRAGGRAYARLGGDAARRPGGESLLAMAGGDPANVTARMVFDVAATGDPAANEVVTELTRRLGRGIANIASVLDPELVLLGGGLSSAGAAVLEPIARAVEELTPGSPRVVLSELGGEATALGAVRLALNHADVLLFDTSAGRV
jgi:predicted NBD/HSP70 family sugar kinase